MDWDELVDIVKCVVLPVVILGSIFVGLVGGLVVISERSICHTLTAIDQEHSYRWTFWTGCLVQTPSGRWVHWGVSSYHDIDIVGGE